MRMIVPVRFTAIVFLISSSVTICSTLSAQCVAYAYDTYPGNCRTSECSISCYDEGAPYGDGPPNTEAHICSHSPGHTCTRSTEHFCTPNPGKSCTQNPEHRCTSSKHRCITDKGEVCRASEGGTCIPARHLGFILNFNRALESQIAGLIQAPDTGDPQQVRKWSDEMFLLALHSPEGWNRVAAEKNALIPLSTIDPELALKRLNDVEAPQLIPGISWFPEDVRADAAVHIFQDYWKMYGRARLPEIQASATHIGETGEYPYRAMGMILSDLLRAGNADDRAMADSIVDEAINFYKRKSKFEDRNFQFLDLLQFTRSKVSRDRYVAALRMFVSHLTRETPLRGHFIAEVGTPNGFAQFRDLNRALLFCAVPLISEIDSRWAALLVSQYPDLQPATKGATYFAAGIVFGDYPPATLVQLEQRVLQMSYARNIQNSRVTNPALAFQMEKRLADLESRSAELSHFFLR